MHSPAPGSHLFTPRIGYTHHGIYVGDNKVIHYCGLANGLVAGPVEQTTLECFLQGRDLRIREYARPRYTGMEAVQRARSRLGESSYDVHANNCEHFCTWVIMGCASSVQAEVAEDVLGVVVPSPVVGVLVKARRHVVQGSNSPAIAKDVADVAVASLISATVAVPALPALLAYKAFKWWTK